MNSNCKNKGQVWSSGQLVVPVTSHFNIELQSMLNVFIDICGYNAYVANVIIMTRFIVVLEDYYVYE